MLLANGKSRLDLLISEEEITELERWMDDFDAELEPLRFFILPSGGKAAATIHVCRTVCRRAERSMVFLRETEEVRPELIKYLNRLSDYLFILARYIAKISGEKEDFWNPSERAK
jgi:cob(I)alamin adenosyltransferase